MNGPNEEEKVIINNISFWIEEVKNEKDTKFIPGDSKERKEIPSKLKY